MTLKFITNSLFLTLETCYLKQVIEKDCKEEWDFEIK